MWKKHFNKNLSIAGIFISAGIFLFLLSPKNNFPQTALVNPVRELARGIGPRARIELDLMANRGAFSNGVNNKVAAVAQEAFNPPRAESAVKSIDPVKPTHRTTPDIVKAIYMTSWVASTRDWRSNLVDFVNKSEINSVVIDVKDYSGHILFDTGNEEIKAVGAEEVRMNDLKEFINTLHKDSIYVIARITVFQDPIYSKKYISQAVQHSNGTLWKDRKGLSYVDPGSTQYRNYIVSIAKASEQIGFDELNFDYIRFPSDGNMSDIVFPISKKRDKQEILESFFKNLQTDMANVPVPRSADLFGMTMTNRDDLNIGQVLERALPYFDYIAPMVYPSHYPPGFHNFKNPADHPYDVVHIAMTSGVERTLTASSSPSKLRPWLQDFDLGALYDVAKVRAQIQATYDAGLTSWMVWDPGNKYTRDAFLPR